MLGQGVRRGPYSDAKHQWLQPVIEEAAYELHLYSRPHYAGSQSVARDVFASLQQKRFAGRETKLQRLAVPACMPGSRVSP